MQELPEAYVETMLKGIIGLDIAVTRLEGKYKLSQNRPAADRPGVIAALEAQGDPESHAVARLMRDRKPG
jgi:transcriptional regulator